MDNNLNTKIAELASKEINLCEIDEKINLVLDERDDVNKAYDELLDEEESIKRNTTIRNRKYMVLGAFFAVCAMVVLAFLAVCATNIFVSLATVVVGTSLNMAATVINIATVVAVALAILYEGVLFAKSYNDKEKIYAQLEENEGYKRVLEQIKDKERQMKYLDMEYESLANERDDLEFEIDSLRIKISAGTGVVEIEEMLQDTKSAAIESSLANDDEYEGQKKNNGPVRRRGIGHRR